MHSNTPETKSHNLKNHTLAPNDSSTINRLRLPLAIGVVFIHLNISVSGRSIHWFQFSDTDFYRLTACMVVNELANLAVPLFFVISGYLFFRNIGLEAGRKELQQFYVSKLSSRTRSLLLPYIIFNLLAVIGLVSSQMVAGQSLSHAASQYLAGGKWLHCFWDIHHTGTSTNILGISKLTAYPINIPLWFMRDLMVLTIFSPAIYYAIKWMSHWWIALLLTLTLTNIWIPLPGFGVTCCLFFSIGAWFSLTGRSIAQQLNPHRWWLTIIATLLAFTDILCDGLAMDSVVHIAFLITGVLSIYALAQRCNHAARPWAAQASFFIFATHTLPIICTGTRPVEWCKNLVWTNSTNGYLCCIQLITSALLTAAICLITFLVLNKLSPAFMNFITGRK